MLATEALITYLHFTGIFILISCLVLEYILLKPNLSNAEAKKISTTDMWYGIASGIILVTGLLKVTSYGKGVEYYMHNFLFWSKIALFSLIGLFSVLPTLRFLSWRKELKAGNDIELSSKQYQLLKNIIKIELTLFVFIPLIANFMARGFGYFQ